MRKVRWGVLGVARIAVNRVIPAMKRSECCEVAGIASRDLARAQAAAREPGIPKAYGSYEEMLADPEIEAVYNPLPNHLHVPWSIRAAEAGKHVLCEKPIGMNVAETLELLTARDRTGVLIGEAFMVQVHPQWRRIVDLVRAGRIGKLRSAIGTFSYFKLEADNIRNVREYGGGGLMDIGCYPIKTSRMVFGEEPARVSAAITRDPRFGNIDMLTSAILEFPSGHCIFTCSTQIALQQSMRFYGTEGRLEPELPFNAATGRVARIRIDDGRDLEGGGAVVEEIPPCDQYVLQGDAFSRAIRGEGQVPVPLEDALKNMAVIDAVFRSAETGAWEEPASLLQAAGAAV
ncbi:MAG TPA: Gfo/Idh/MocA family oxidoreductase [Candidatus Acidoferrales bacterium]|nr:Gfo/Idh/MocA family oxidoreductase [Candidatus Acidoferrales bacterium]